MRDREGGREGGGGREGKGGREGGEGGEEGRGGREGGREGDCYNRRFTDIIGGNFGTLAHTELNLRHTLLWRFLWLAKRSN